MAPVADACETLAIGETKEHAFSKADLALPTCATRGALEVKNAKVTILE